MLRQLTDHSLLSFVCRAQFAASTALSSFGSRGFQSCSSTCLEPASAGLLQVLQLNCCGCLWQGQQQRHAEQQQDEAHRQDPLQHNHQHSATSQPSVQSVQQHLQLSRCGAQHLQHGVAVVQWADLCRAQPSSSPLLSTASHLYSHCFRTWQAWNPQQRRRQPELGVLCAASLFGAHNMLSWPVVLKSYATQRNTSGQQPNANTNSNSSRGKDSGKRAAGVQFTTPEPPAAQQQQQQSRVNQQIRAAELMVVFPDGTKQVGRGSPGPDTRPASRQTGSDCGVPALP